MAQPLNQPLGVVARDELGDYPTGLFETLKMTSFVYGGMFDSKAEMLQALEQPSRSPAKPDQPAPIVVKEFFGKVVVGVSDGDTITVLRNGEADSLIPRMPLLKTWTA